MLLTCCLLSMWRLSRWVGCWTIRCLQRVVLAGTVLGAQQHAGFICTGHVRAPVQMLIKLGAGVCITHQAAFGDGTDLPHAVRAIIWGCKHSLCRPAHADLMSQNEEDDATFWSRLISEPDRPQDELLAPLGPRAARNKQQQQPEDKSPSPPAHGSRQLSQRYSEELPDSGGGGGARPSKPKKARRPGKAVSRVSDKPGAPVEGAVLRIDRWPLEAAEGGKVGRGVRARDGIPCCDGAPQMLERG